MIASWNPRLMKFISLKILRAKLSGCSSGRWLVPMCINMFLTFGVLVVLFNFLKFILITTNPSNALKIIKRHIFFTSHMILADLMRSIMLSLNASKWKCWPFIVFSCCGLIIFPFLPAVNHVFPLSLEASIISQTLFVSFSIVLHEWIWSSVCLNCSLSLLQSSLWCSRLFLFLYYCLFLALIGFW